MGGTVNTNACKNTKLWWGVFPCIISSYWSYYSILKRCHERGSLTQRGRPSSLWSLRFPPFLNWVLSLRFLVIGTFMSNAGTIQALIDPSRVLRESNQSMYRFLDRASPCFLCVMSPQSPSIKYTAITCIICGIRHPDNHQCGQATRTNLRRLRIMTSPLRIITSPLEL